MPSPLRQPCRETRRHARAAYATLLDATISLLFRHDFALLDFGGNTDEYALEAGTILPRLRDCHDACETAAMMREEFVRWFSATEAGPTERFMPAAQELWALWQQHRATFGS